LHYRNAEDLRRRIGITNSYLGWIFLVDHEARVRWHAHGMATPGELETMRRLARVLDERRAAMGIGIR